MPRDVAIVVDAIADTEPIEPRTEIEEHAELPAHARLAEQHATRHAPQMPVTGKPAIVLVLVEQVEDHVVGIVVECLCGHWVHPPAAKARILAWDRLSHSSKFATGLMPAA
jgi:hypothetical protein